MDGQNPFAKIKQRKITEKEIRYVNIQEYRALMKKAKSSWWQAFLSLAYGSGLRRNEILHLTWKDIDFENQLIKITAKKGNKNVLQWKPKNRKNRIVPMSEESAQLLANLQAQAKEGFPYIFISPERLEIIMWRQRNGKWNERSEPINNVVREFNKIRCQAGVAKCTLHDLRRSAITNWAKKLPIQVVQQLAGHSSITTTRKYYLAVRPEDFALANKWLNLILARACDD